MDHFTAEGCSLSDAVAQAKSVMRNVKFPAEMADLCVIRNMSNAVLCEVHADAARP